MAAHCAFSILFSYKDRIMYNLPNYKAKDRNEVLAFMRAHPFALLTGIGETYPVATQIPLFVKERDDQLFLQGHIMRGTDHHKAFEANPHVLAVFTGAHTYVSASWYENKQQASTWNYQSVHVQGIFRFLEEAQLLQMLEELTMYFEKQDSPSAYKHLSPEYIHRLSKAIVAFEVEVTHLDHVFKLSQNRDAKSYNNIIDHLKQGDGDAQQVAAAMEKNKG